LSVGSRRLNRYRGLARSAGLLWGWPAVSLWGRQRGFRGT